MPLIPEDVIDEIQTRADIAELIGRYVPLKRAGRHLKGLCPFHKERTASFTVNPEKQIFYCFGCQAGGNIFSFLMQHDRMTFPEAVRQLGEHVGVSIPEQGSDEHRGIVEQLAVLTEKACSYFERTLAHPEQGRAAREYLRERGVTEEGVRRFRLGLAPEGWTRLLEATQSAGVTPEQLEAAGLAIRGTRGQYDRFRSRLIFPILDAWGRVVGFGGRSLDGRDPKYLNSPETPLYTKGRHLFGLAQAKEAVAAGKTAVIVEGYFDCVVLAAGGIAHVVSPLGTALTEDQARLLKRYADQVVLAFDPDAAGETATLRGIDLAVEIGVQVRIANLPPGQDPDELFRAWGVERLRNTLAGGEPVLEWLLGAARRRFPGRSVEEKVAAAQFILPTIAKVPNAMLRSEYVRQVAERLQLDEGAVAQELARVRPRGVGEALAQARPVPPSAGQGGQGPERMFVALILDDPSRWEAVRASVSPDDLADETLGRILGVVDELWRASRSVNAAQVISRLSHEGHEALVSQLVNDAQTVSNTQEAFEECARRLQAAAGRRHGTALEAQLRAAEAAGEDREVRRLQVQLHELRHAGQGGG